MSNWQANPVVCSHLYSSNRNGGRKPSWADATKNSIGMLAAINNHPAVAHPAQNAE